jgi:hypothetical protein
VFNPFSKKSKGTHPFVVTEPQTYKFGDLPKMPESQLVMLVPLRIWQRLPEYIANYESIGLAGRFGAEPGDYEWEWVVEPEAVRWWRRAASGQESLFGMALAVQRGDKVENSPHWSEVIPEEAANAMPGRAKLAARTPGQKGTEQDILSWLYREYFRNKGMLTLDNTGEPALRRGTIREVERFRDAINGLLERASKVKLPSEAR